MHQAVARPKDQRLPPALNIVALGCFSAALSGRALDPVLPHVADDFGVTIAAAASFASVFAFTFAAIQPLVGAAADLFGKARLMIFCLVILGISNLVGALATSFPLLFASRILAGIGAGGVFPVALGLASDLVSSEKRQVGIGYRIYQVPDNVRFVVGKPEILAPERNDFEIDLESGRARHPI